MRSRREIAKADGVWLRERADWLVECGQWRFGYYLMADEDDPEIITHIVPYTAGPVDLRENG